MENNMLLFYFPLSDTTQFLLRKLPTHSQVAYRYISHTSVTEPNDHHYSLARASDSVASRPTIIVT